MKKTTKVIAAIMMIVIVFSLAACGGKKENTDGEKSAAFPGFTGTDYEGAKVDNEMFKNNAVTVLNFWFNGCSACVSEMPELEKINKELKEKGGELIGVNAEIGLNKGLLEESKTILSKQGATYRNIYMDPESEGGKYVAKILAFPTTVLVNRKGEIVGDPIVGAINGSNREELDKRIDEIIKADAGK